MLLIKIWPLVILLLLTGCPNGQRDNYCENAEPIYLEKGDKLTPDTAREILIYDDKGHALCGWPFTV